MNCPACNTAITDWQLNSQCGRTHENGPIVDEWSCHVAPCGHSLIRAQAITLGIIGVYVPTAAGG